MQNIQQVLSFVSVARLGNFAAAARELGQAPSTTAKSVARLEQQLGLKLFHRTTRQVRLTGDGERLFEHCRRILDEVEQFRAVAAGVSGKPAGVLKLDVPLAYGRSVVVPRLAELQRRYPALALDVRFSDQMVDVIAEGLDAVIRIGALSDSRLVAQRIGWQQLVVCASTSYLAAAGTPRTPAALAKHRCLAFRLPTTGRPRPWQFSDAGEALEWTPAVHTVFGDGEALVAMALAGQGLIQVPDYMAAAALKRGRLREVLRRFRPAPMPIQLVYPSRHLVPPRLQVLIDALRASAA